MSDTSTLNIGAWALGAYNPKHEQIDLSGPFPAPQDDSYLGDASGRDWLMFFGLAAIVWAPIFYGIYRGFRG